MLSHLVGAANRADIRRLRQLEQENAALLIKIERQHRQLRDGFAVRDQSIRRLNEMLLQQDILASSRTSPIHAKGRMIFASAAGIGTGKQIARSTALLVISRRFLLSVNH
jgi:hypothetical protein